MNVARDKIEAPTVKKWIQAEGIDLVRIADAQNLILAYFQPTHDAIDAQFNHQDRVVNSWQPFCERSRK